MNQYNKITITRFSVFQLLILTCSMIFSLTVQAKQNLSKNNLQKIFNEELAFIKEGEKLAVDELWALQNISELNQNKKLKKFIKQKLSSVSNDPYLLLLDPSAPKIILPDEIGIGMQKLMNYMSAPFGEPEKRAASYMDQFLGYKATGYILTHQFFVLEWAIQTGVISAGKYQIKKQEILKNIYDEQLKAKYFSDLYVERVVILLKYSNVEFKDIDNWISLIVQMRKSSGGWGLFETRAKFEGQEAMIKPGDIHTRVLAIWAIQLYLATI